MCAYHDMRKFASSHFPIDRRDKLIHEVLLNYIILKAVANARCVVGRADAETSPQHVAVAHFSGLARRLLGVPLLANKQILETKAYVARSNQPSAWRPRGLGGPGHIYLGSRRDHSALNVTLSRYQPMRVRPLVGRSIGWFATSIRVGQRSRIDMRSWWTTSKGEHVIRMASSGS